MNERLMGLFAVMVFSCVWFVIGIPLGIIAGYDLKMIFQALGILWIASVLFSLPMQPPVLQSGRSVK